VKTPDPPLTEEKLQEIRDRHERKFGNRIYEKADFMEEMSDKSSAERSKMSESLYRISEQRAADMQKSSENKDITIKRLWIANVIQVLIIAALAGVTVTGKIPGVGDIGLDKEKTEKPSKKSDD